MSQKKSYLSIVWIALITIAAGTLLITLSNASPL